MTLLRQGLQKATKDNSMSETKIPPHIPQIRRYQNWLREQRGLKFASYHELWRWSVTDLDAYWQSVWDYFDLYSPTPHAAVLANNVMPGAVWFPGAQANYAQQVLRHAAPADAAGFQAIISRNEKGEHRELSWPELRRQVASLALHLKAQGVQPGDRVAAYLPNIPETMVAFLATASIGGVWSLCAPDMGTNAVLDRFKQIAPKVLIACDGVRYGGRDLGPEAGGVWRHGDWLRIGTPEQGGEGCVIFGRSDATINRHGLRMGTSELYSAVEVLPEVMDALVVDLEYLGRESYMPLFVVLREGVALDDAMKVKLNNAIKTALSPRFVPNAIFQVAEIPRTLSGKKQELPIKKLLLGQPLEKVVNKDAMANPGCLDWYVAFAQKRLAGQVGAGGVA